MIFHLTVNLTWKTSLISWKDFSPLRKSRSSSMSRHPSNLLTTLKCDRCKVQLSGRGLLAKIKWQELQSYLILKWIRIRTLKIKQAGLPKKTSTLSDRHSCSQARCQSSDSSVQVKIGQSARQCHQVGHRLQRQAGIQSETSSNKNLSRTLTPQISDW